MIKANENDKQNGNESLTCPEGECILLGWCVAELIQFNITFIYSQIGLISRIRHEADNNSVTKPAKNKQINPNNECPSQRKCAHHWMHDVRSDRSYLENITGTVTTPIVIASPFASWKKWMTYR